MSQTEITVPTRGEVFSWSMPHATRVVRAVRPNGQVLRSAADRNGNATHTLTPKELVQMQQRSKNAADFIRRINESVCM